VRFSFNPRHWVWSLEEYEPAPISLRGRWASEKPDVNLANIDPASGPLSGLPVIAVKGQTRISALLKGTVTDLAYDAAGDRFLVTTQQGIYLLDAVLGRTLRYTMVDTAFSVDLGRFAGAAFLDPSTVLAVGENKSFVVLKENDQADPDRNFRFFLESFDRFDEVTRSRFGTVRARMMYAMSAAFDPATASIYTITVPNTRVKRLVVSRFDRRDMTLSEEFVPAIAPDSGLTLAGEKRSLDEYYVTGAGVADGKLYAISAAHGVLLTIDLASHAVVAAHQIAGLSRPVGLAIRGGELYLADADGTIRIVDRP
jgi:hypothetical protein